MTLNTTPTDTIYIISFTFIRQNALWRSKTIMPSNHMIYSVYDQFTEMDIYCLFQGH